jgi:hypothetical protein
MAGSMAWERNGNVRGMLLLISREAYSKEKSMEMRKYYDTDGIPVASNGTLPHGQRYYRWRYALRHTAVIWALALGVSWLAGLGVVKLIAIVISVFHTAHTP